MICPKCGAPVNDGEEYCSKCGYPILKTEKRKRPVFVFALIIAAEVMIIVAAAVFLFSHMKDKAKDEAEGEQTTITAEVQEEETNEESGELENVPEEEDSKQEPENPEEKGNIEAESASSDTAEEISAAEAEPVVENMAEPAPGEEAVDSPAQPVESAATMELRTDEETVNWIQSTYKYLTTNLITATSSKTIEQKDVQNLPIYVFDNTWMSNWQEGESGPGIGAYVQGTFDGTYAVNALTLRLGNWKTDRYFYGNNRPKTLKIELGGQTFTPTFPDEWAQFSLLFSSPIKASDIKITVEDIYKGAEWDDTVITDICVWYN